MLALAALCCALSPAGASALAPGTTVLVSRPSGLGALPAAPGSGEARYAATSADGRYVAFAGTADGLLPDPEDDVRGGVYVRDRALDTTTFIGTYFWASQGFDISDDGSVVCWQTGDKLHPDDTDSDVDVYLAQTANSAATPVLVSRTDADANRSGSARDCVLSGDGQHVAFVTIANLDPADTNGTEDVYRRALGPGTTTLVSRADGAAGAVGNAYAAEPSIDQDGSTIAFTSVATNLDGGFPGGIYTGEDVFVRDLDANTVTLASVRDDEGTPDARSTEGELSADGDEVAFQTTGSNLVAGQNDGAADLDVFRRKLSTGQTVLVSRADGAAGAIAGDGGSNPRISADGERIMFVTGAPLAPGDTAGEDEARVVVRDVGANTSRTVNRYDGPAGTRTANGFVAALAAGGNVAVFWSFDPAMRPDDGDDFAHLYARDVAAGTTEPVDRPTGPATAPFPGGENSSNLGTARAVSDSGRYVAFTSQADGLEPGTADDGQGAHVFVRDVVDGTTELVDRATGAAGAILPALVGSYALSADGRKVAFSTSARLDPAHPAGTEQTYVRDLDADTTTLVGRATGGAVADDSTSVPSLSGDGRKVAFVSEATNLGAPGGAVRQLYVRDLETGTTVIASRADGAAGGVGDRAANFGALDGDGDRVVWTTSATNLGDGDVDTQTDVHLRDLTTGDTQLVSVSTGGTKTSTYSSGVAISRDGNRIAFSTGTALDPADVTAGDSAYLRDVAAGTTTLVSRPTGTGGGAANTSGLATAISADGTAVVFSSAGAMEAGDVNGERDIWLRTVATGTTVLVSRGEGAAGARLVEGDLVGGAAVNADGTCVAYGVAARGPLLPAGASPDFFHIVLRAVGECLPPVVGPPDPEPGDPGPGDPGPADPGPGP
ncbi:MAG TPA: hypothetical protein VN238_03365, partial [Solirubrobacteraceae bacterium]|nr:hypothetical protein [Solirubrobacteraceae bacterium]